MVEYKCSFYGYKEVEKKRVAQNKIMPLKTSPQWREENSTGEEGRPTSHVNCKQTWWLAGAAAPPCNQEQESL
jgi:hypothetical protein